MQRRYARKFFLLVLAVFLGENVKAYKSIFGHNSTQWVFEWHNSGLDRIDTAFVAGEKIINGLTYKVIDTKFPYFDSVLLREDTVQGKVWFINYNGDRSGCDFDKTTAEILAFDFSLLPGAHFNITGMWTGCDTTSGPGDNVDSTSVINGLRYIYFHRQHYSFGSISYSEPFTMIEGVGCIESIMYKMYGGGEMFQYLLCSYKDGIKTDYSNRQYSGSCSPSLSVHTQLHATHETLSFCPNPASVKIDLRNIHEVQSLSLYAADGRLLFHIEGDIPYSVPLDKYPSGNYYLESRMSDGSRNLHPLIIRH